MSIETALDAIIPGRAARRLSPAHLATLAMERRETTNAFNDMGRKALNTANEAILKAPLTLITSALKSTPGMSKNYGTHNAVWDSLKGFGKAGWEATKFTGAALNAAGRTAKYGARWLIAA